MSEKRKKYDREFREGAVRIVEESRGVGLPSVDNSTEEHRRNGANCFESQHDRHHPGQPVPDQGRTTLTDRLGRAVTGAGRS